MSRARSLIKEGAAAVLCRSGANRLVSRVAGRYQPLVLGYHSVVEDVRLYGGRAIPANLISVAMLEQQLDWIGRRYQFLTLDELGAHLESGEPFARPSAVVTFDDGYATVYRHAFPLLTRKGIPGGAFVVTDLVGRTQLQIYDKLYLSLLHVLPKVQYSPGRLVALLLRQGVHVTLVPPAAADVFSLMRWLYTGLDQETLWRVVEVLACLADVDDAAHSDLHAMTWEMAVALDRGGMTIGSHTHTHALLTLEQPQTVTQQLAVSADILRRKLGRPVRHFAYPDGRFNPMVVASVQETGYRFGYTTCLHRDAAHPRLTISRKLLWEKACLDGSGRFSSDLMSCMASRVFDQWAGCGSSHEPHGPGSSAKAGMAAQSSPTTQSRALNV
jgi:peptidoglycan/xylan/chitin deacetylase (PgdA/CDA1 family)